jgi:hypothetical protein
MRQLVLSKQYLNKLLRNIRLCIGIRVQGHFAVKAMCYVIDLQNALGMLLENFRGDNYENPLR